MDKIEFKGVETEDIPSRSYRKRSKYDELIKAFDESGAEIFQFNEVKVKGKVLDANYVRTQLNKRLLSLGRKDVSPVVRNGVLYLKKV